MVEVIDLDEVRRLLDEEGAQLVEVLPRAEYEEEHLPGALSLPLKSIGPAAAGALDPARPVIVYCYDWLCDMSPRGRLLGVLPRAEAEKGLGLSRSRAQGGG